MKASFIFSIAAFFMLNAVQHSAFAQGEEERIKVKLSLNFGGKVIVSDLTSVSTSLTRSYDEQPSDNLVKDSTKSSVAMSTPGTFYLSMDAKNMSDDLLKVFAKKQNRFDGTITIVDSYGKNPTRTIKFKQASLYSYSDQMSDTAYRDGYGAYAISLFCREISINGITLEQ